MMLRGLLFVLALSSAAIAQQLDYDIDLIDWEVANSNYAEVKKDGSAIGFADDDSYSDFGTATTNNIWGIPNADLYVSRDAGTAWAEVKECFSTAHADTVNWPDTGVHESCSISVQLVCRTKVNNAGPNPVYQSTARGWSRGQIEKHLDITDANRGAAQLIEAYLGVMLSASHSGYHSAQSYQAATLDGDSWVWASWQLNTNQNPPRWMWKITRKRRLANSNWENPTPPHLVESWHENNAGFFHWNAYAVVVDNFYVGAYANMNNQSIECIARTPTGGSNPYPTYSQVDAEPFPSARVKSVTKAW